MKLSDLLLDDRIVSPLEATDLAAALRSLISRIREAGFEDPQDADRLASELAAGRTGEIIRVNADVMLVIARVEGLERLSGMLGVAARPFRTGSEEEGGSARSLLVLFTPRAVQTLKAAIVPALVRVLRSEERTQQLLVANSVEKVRALTELMDTELRERHLVSDAVTPVQYRVYPDTPLLEIVDLMVRRGLRAVPVVGERYEVLGLITVGDALKEVLPPRGAGETEQPNRLARDVMTRSVLCVSEDQSLTDAAGIMVNRSVDQLPVVRDGELVGFLTRAAILRLLFPEREED